MFITRYLNWFEIANGRELRVCMLCLAFGLITINNVLFERLSLYPDTMPTFPKVDIMAGNDFEEFEINNNKSFTYKATWCSDPPLMNVTSFFKSFFYPLHFVSNVWIH